ncbi:hexokinase-domain-containing protein [Cladochytrium replicatum]|nr:hexokinase-domain-containing protein [Cladochytrium replicatum]
MAEWTDSKTPLFLFGLTTGIAVSAATQFLFNALAQQKKPAQRPVPTIANAPSPNSVPYTPISIGFNSSSQQFGLFSESENLSKLEKDFSISAASLNRIVKHFIAEMKKGLQADGNTLKMIPSFVENRPDGTETGAVLALDMGGTNFRVCEVILEGQGRVRMRQRKFAISEQLKTGTADKLFDFFVDCIQKFLDEVQADLNEERRLGFTFSFPVQQTAINKGYLMHWNKGFTATGVEGTDVVDLLTAAIRRKKLHIHVSALVNDTVGTLMAHAYSDPQTHVGVILGTGTNAAYFESIDRVPKWAGGPVHSGEMVINTEWGAFDNEQVVLPVTKYDQQLDRASANSGIQIFEKMISGMYLGELVRLALVDLISIGELFRGKSSTELARPYSFETAYMSRIERDHTLELSDTKAVLEDLFQIPATSTRDRRIVKRVCELVGIRSARLAAAGVAAVVTKINRLDGCTVAIDGSLFEQYPHYANRMRDALREVLGLSSENIVLDQARDGSGQGAALIAATARF